MNQQRRDDEENEETCLFILASGEGKHLVRNDQHYDKTYGVPSYHHLAECVNELLSFFPSRLKLDGGFEELGNITRRCMCFTISSIWKIRIFHLIKLQSQRIFDIMIESLSFWASLWNTWVLEDDL